MTLFKQHIRSEWLTLLVWGLALALMQIFMVLMGHELQTTGSLAQMIAMLKSMPPAMQEMYGVMADLTTTAGWLQAYSFGGFLHIPMLVFTGLYVTGLITREMDRRTIEFLLTQPVARWQVVLARWSSLAAGIMTLLAANVLGVVIGVIAIGEPPDLIAYLVALLNWTLLYLAVGSLLLAASMLVNDYSTGLGVTLGGGLASYLLYSMGADAKNALADVRALMPFSLYNPAPILLDGQVPVGDMAILALVAGAGLALSIYLFQRKQIAV